MKHANLNLIGIGGVVAVTAVNVLWGPAAGWLSVGIFSILTGFFGMLEDHE